MKNSFTVLIPLPTQDFDPTEAAIPWKLLTQNQIKVVFCTPDAKPAQADSIMVTGQGLGIWSSLLKADEQGIRAYEEMRKSSEFLTPIRWDEATSNSYDGLILPGGHAIGMKEYLESPLLQKLVVDFFAAKKLVAGICHGVLLAARSKTEGGRSVLYGFQTTAVLRTQELMAWALTGLWLKNYYRTYPETVQSEVTRSLARADDFITGPRLPLRRDTMNSLQDGFVVEDRNYLSARWPGDVHLFATKIVKYLKSL